MAVITAGALDAQSSDLTNAQLKKTAARLTALMRPFLRLTTAFARVSNRSPRVTISAIPRTSSGC